MIRAFLLFAKIGLLAAGAFWLADNPGRITMNWLGYRIDMSVGVMIILILLAGFLVALVWRFWRSVRAAPGQFVKYRSVSRREKGYRALTQGLVAVAAGDRQEAAKQSRKAKALLNDPPLTMLLSAQSAQLSGDEAAAENYFRAMLDDPQTAFLGVRGLMMQALKAGDREEALTLAQQAYELRPDTPWVLTELLERQQEIEDWDSALKTLDEARKAGVFEPAEISRLRAGLLLEKARRAERDYSSDQAFYYARQALRHDPALSDAAMIAARYLASSGKQRKAEKVIEQVWAKKTAASLAQIYGTLGAARSPLENLKHMQRLAALNPSDLESHIAVARAALDAGLWGEARQQLTRHAVLDAPCPRICRLMAELEEAENGDSTLARKWLERASHQESEAKIVTAP